MRQYCKLGLNVWCKNVSTSKTIASKEAGTFVDVDERFCKLSKRSDFLEGSSNFPFVTKKVGNPDFPA